MGSSTVVSKYGVTVTSSLISFSDTLSDKLLNAKLLMLGWQSGNIIVHFQMRSKD
jgi:hypothetical protein